MLSIHSQVTDLSLFSQADLLYLCLLITSVRALLLCLKSIFLCFQFASILMGLSNTFATLPGIISPALTGAIVTRKVGFFRALGKREYLVITRDNFC